MKRNCPNLSCPYHQKSDEVIKDGTFFRSSDSRFIQRFKCKACKKKFSAASFTLEKYQKKRRINHPLFKLFASGISQRRAAIILNVNRKTVERKFKYLGIKARIENEKFRDKLKKSKIQRLEFDDLITKENSKLKPLSVSLAVDSDRRFILGGIVSQIPAFGHLAKRARQKYGYRKCYHEEGLKELFDQLKPITSSYARIRSDEHHRYKKFVIKNFPNASYEQFKSERSCVVGQGELKRVRFDPLFAINHTCALMRANINRLVRKTWCTTKCKDRLRDHIEIFILFFNKEILLKKRPLTPG